MLRVSLHVIAASADASYASLVRIVTSIIATNLLLQERRQSCLQRENRMRRMVVIDLAELVLSRFSVGDSDPG